MLPLERPVLSLTIDALVNMSGEDALCGLLTLFLKCKAGLQDGDRLENMAKRLWHVERASSQCCFPVSPALSPPGLVASHFTSSSLESESDVSSESETSNHDQTTTMNEVTCASNREASTLSKCLSPDPPAEPDGSERHPHKHGKSSHRSPSPVSVSSRRTSPDRRPSLARRRTHSNTSIGQIMADLLPDKLDLQRSTSMNGLLEESTGNAKSPSSTTEECVPTVVVLPDVPVRQPQAQPSPPVSSSSTRFPTVVIVTPTPRPTPPMTPQVSPPPTSPPTGSDDPAAATPVNKVTQGRSSTRPSSSNPRPASATRTSSSRRSSKSSGSAKRMKAKTQVLPSPSVKQPRLEFADDSDFSTDTEWDTEDGSEEADATGGENDRATADKAAADKAAADKAAADKKLAEAAEEAQRQRDLFTRVDRRAYSDLTRVRTQPGLLSVMFHPDPNLFPPDHPYRHSRSSQDILAHVPRPSYAPLQPSRGTAAAPVAAPVTAQGVGSPNLTNARQRSPLRLKGRPQDVEESESEEEENKPHVSESVAEKRLAMLHQNARGGRPRAPSRQPQQEPRPRETRQETNAPTAATQTPTGFYGAPGPGPSLARVATEPIPLGYPYNLPPPMPPSSPRTTRRIMLTHELSESLRRNLLWERQVSKQRPMGLGQRAVTNAPAPIAGPSRLRTSMTAAPNINGQGAALRNGDASAIDEAAKDKELREKRNRSWADDYHATGW